MFIANCFQLKSHLKSGPCGRIICKHLSCAPWFGHPLSQEMISAALQQHFKFRSFESQIAEGAVHEGPMQTSRRHPVPCGRPSASSRCVNVREGSAQLLLGPVSGQQTLYGNSRAKRRLLPL